MMLRIGDLAPNFIVESTTGPINFHEWIGDSWAFFFSHPADYTPVCTTEMGRTSQLASEFEKRNTKAIAAFPPIRWKSIRTGFWMLMTPKTHPCLFRSLLMLISRLLGFMK